MESEATGRKARGEVRRGTKSRNNEIYNREECRGIRNIANHRRRRLRA
jgi:hypothetical protein